MKPNETYAKARLIRIGCATMCLFYLLGLFNGLVLETLHEVSHVFAPKTHHHGFASEHETIDYSSLEAMAGHSHEALEALKDLLEANQSDEQDSNNDVSFKLDKHLVEEHHIYAEINASPVVKNHWAYQSLASFWFQSVTTPPPQRL